MMVTQSIYFFNGDSLIDSFKIHAYKSFHSNFSEFKVLSYLVVANQSLNNGPQTLILEH